MNIENIENIEKQNINRIFKSEEFTRQKIAQKASLYKKIIYLCRTISILSAISFILILCNILKIVAPNIILVVVILIGFPLSIAELLNLDIKRYEKKFKNNLKSQITPILMGKLSNIEKTNNAFNINDLKNSGLFTNEDSYDEDDAFIFNYKNKKAYISEGETFDYSSKGHQRYNIKRWLLIGFYTQKNLNHQTVIKPKTLGENTFKHLPLIIIGTFLMSFIVFWSGLYYIDLFKKADTYLTNPFQCIINIGFPIGFALAVLIVLLLPFILKEKPWIKKEGVTLEDFEFMKKFNVKSSNQIEVRYFLTPAFMQKFIKLQNTFKTKDIRCSFYKNKVIIAINVKEDLFEVANLNEPLISQKYIRKTVKQLNTIKKIILALDEDK